ncbi:MAG: DUF5320 family protein [Candidatus Izemoplasmatales bacterium]|jgi:hypothetical protein
MPRRDGTGPNGLGAGTGRGLGGCLRTVGYCYLPYGFRRGVQRFPLDVSTMDETGLKAEKIALETRLQEINSQLKP